VNVQVEPIPKQNVFSCCAGTLSVLLLGACTSGTTKLAIDSHMGSARQTAGDSKVKAYEMTTANASLPGCNYHPSIITQAALASELKQQLKDELGW